MVIVNWNTRDHLLRCIASVHHTCKAGSFEVWVVDNASHDDSVAAVMEAFPGTRLILNARNRGFAAANNQALRRIGSPYVLLLNTDTELTPQAVAHLLDHMRQCPEAGMVCGQLLNPDGSPQNSFANFPSLLTLLTNEGLLRWLWPGRFPSHRRKYAAAIEVDSGIGACLLVRQAAMAGVGLLDERFFFFLEETDWARRMRQAGWRVYFVPQARIYHAQGQSVGHRFPSRALFFRARYQYFHKWHPRTYPVFYGLIALRLGLNTVLTLLGIALSLGRLPGLRRKLATYLRLIAWHFEGCPPIQERTGDAA